MRLLFKWRELHWLTKIKIRCLPHPELSAPEQLEASPWYLCTVYALVNDTAMTWIPDFHKIRRYCLSVSSTKDCCLGREWNNWEVRISPPQLTLFMYFLIFHSWVPRPYWRAILDHCSSHLNHDLKIIVPNKLWNQHNRLKKTFRSSGSLTAGPGYGLISQPSLQDRLRLLMNSR